MIKIRLENDKYFNWDVENEKNILIAGGIGSGKSVILSQLQTILNGYGLNTFFIGREICDSEKEVKTIISMLKQYPSQLFVIIDELYIFDNFYNIVELIEELQQNQNLHLIVGTQNRNQGFLNKINDNFEINISSIDEKREEHLWLLKRNQSEEIIKFIDTSVRY